MSTTSNRGSRVRSAPALRAGAALVLASALGGALGCTPYSTLKNPSPAVDCSVESAYTFLYIDTFENEMTPNFFHTADHPDAGAEMSVAIAAPPDGPRCGSTAAMQIQAANDDDWGSLIGYNNFGPRNASGYQGVAFWGRVYGNSNRTFTLLLDDPNTYNPNQMPDPPTFNCMTVPTPDGGVTGMSGVITDPATGMVVSSGTTTAEPPANGCGNSFQTVIEVTNAWQLYTIPWSAFKQLAEPNRVPNKDFVSGTTPGTTMITSSLKNFVLRFPKAIVTDLWLDNISFYRARQPGDDAGNIP
jgi:hypothetical protein